jgi:hypothetical protein
VNTVNAQTTLSGNAGGNPQLRVENGATVQNAFGVLGRITAGLPAGQTAGLRGINSGTNANGFGVWGFHQGSGVGVFGETGAGTGVLGKHTASVGTAPGVQGETASTAVGAVGVLGKAPPSAAADSAGIRGVNGGHGFGIEGIAGPQADSIAIFGRGTVAPAVKGVTGSPGSSGDNHVPAVMGVNESTGGSGVFGQANGDSGIGVVGEEYGNASSGLGVSGFSSDGTGVRGFSLGGVGGSFETSSANGGNAVEAKTRASGMSGVLGHYAGGGTNGRGVYGVVTDTGILGSPPNAGIIGVLGEARTTGVGTAGIADIGADAVGVLGRSTSGLAGKFEGKVHVTGTLTRAYTAGTASQATPIAYGVIASDGTLAAATPNVTSSFDAANTRYLITIAGETYSSSSYITDVTARAFTSSPRIAEASSTSGKLAVRFKSLTNTLVQSSFTFVTYKP